MSGSWVGGYIRVHTILSFLHKLTSLTPVSSLSLNSYLTFPAPFCPDKWHRFLKTQQLNLVCVLWTMIMTENFVLCSKNSQSSTFSPNLLLILVFILMLPPPPHHQGEILVLSLIPSSFFILSSLHSNIYYSCLHLFIYSRGWKLVTHGLYLASRGVLFALYNILKNMVFLFPLKN